MRPERSRRIVGVVSGGIAAVAIVVVAAIAVVAWLGSPSSPAAVVQRSATHAPIEAARPVPSLPQAATPAAPARPKLTLADISRPPAGAPVTDVLAALRDAADQGIGQAACHVGVELIRCGRVRTLYGALATAQAAALGAPQNTAESQRAMRQATALAQRLAGDQRACHGVNDEDTHEGWRYVYLAAVGGNVAAMSRFVRDPGIGDAGSPHATEAWAAYNRDALQFLSAAVQAGDVRALEHARFIAAGGRPIGAPGVFQRSPDAAIIYATALRGLLDHGSQLAIDASTVKLIDEVGVERAALARREGERLQAAHFAGAQPIDKGSEDSAGGASNAADCWK